MLSVPTINYYVHNINITQSLLFTIITYIDVFKKM